MKGIQSDADEVVMGDWQGDKRAQSGEAPPVGVYVWAVRVMKAVYYDVKTDKPFILIEVTIEETDARPSGFAGFTFDFRLYVHQKSEGWARYCLKKFNYPDEEGLAAKKPSIRRSLIVGLTGELLVKVYINGEYLNFDVKGFQRLGENELEEARAKLQAEFEVENGGESREPGEEEGPSVDIHADDQGAATEANDALAELDALD